MQKLKLKQLAVLFCLKYNAPNNKKSNLSRSNSSYGSLMRSPSESASLSGSSMSSPSETNSLPVDENLSRSNSSYGSLIKSPSSNPLIVSNNNQTRTDLERQILEEVELAKRKRAERQLAERKRAERELAEKQLAQIPLTKTELVELACYKEMSKLGKWLDFPIVDESSNTTHAANHSPSDQSMLGVKTWQSPSVDKNSNKKSNVPPSAKSRPSNNNLRNLSSSQVRETARNPFLPQAQTLSSHSNNNSSYSSSSYGSSSNNSSSTTLSSNTSQSSTTVSANRHGHPNKIKQFFKKLFKRNPN